MPRPKGSGTCPRRGPFCKGTTRKGQPCGKPPGWGTSHNGTGNCRYHGGASPGAPIGNKNAVTTGEYETIYVSALSESEQDLYERVETKPLPQIEMELKLVCVRIHRMLIRVRRLEEAEALSEDGMELVSASYEAGWDKGKKQNTTKNYESFASSIVHLEEAINRTQSVKVRYIDQLRGAMKENPGQSGGLEAIVAALDRSAAKIAARKEASEAPETEE